VAAATVEAGTGALEGGAAVLDVKVSLAREDYEEWKLLGTHKYSRFENYDWRGDTFEEALKNRYQDMKDKK